MPALIHTDRSRFQLRSGNPPWQTPRLPPRDELKENISCDVLIVGAGITGSLVAEHLVSLSHNVCIVDRDRPGCVSTAASTAMLQWEIDTSLTELTELKGFERATRIYQRSFAATRGLIDLIEIKSLACHFRKRHSLYLAREDVGAPELNREHKLRQNAGLPGDILTDAALADHFQIARDAALYSPGSAEADPRLLSACILTNALNLGARLYDDEATLIEGQGRTATAKMASGFTIEAKFIVLATGYVMPDILKSNLHRVVSSWAVATVPQAELEWPRDALIWEASKKYHYSRMTSDGRVIIGGEDDAQHVAPDDREAVAPEKTEILTHELQAMLPAAKTEIEFAWSGAFGTTVDGLPLIGSVPRHPNIKAAYGYGGNGITFSFMASRMIAADIAGERRPWFDDFAIDRDAEIAAD